jgi:hypothetical protein
MHSLAAEGVGESQFRRGNIYCGALYILYMCFVPLVLFHLVEKMKKESARNVGSSPNSRLSHVCWVLEI